MSFKSPLEFDDWFKSFRPNTGNEKKIIYTLTSDPRMENIWKKVAKLKLDKQLFCLKLFFTSDFTQKPHWRSPHLLDNFSDSLKKIKKSNDRALLTFKKLVDQKDFSDTGWYITFIRGLEKGPFPEKVNGKIVVMRGTNSITRLSLSLQNSNKVIEEYLKATEEYKNLAKLPIRKSNDKNAKRTFFVREISKYLKEKTQKPNHQFVADLTSILFDCDITDDHVRRLLPKNRNIPSK